VTTVVRSGIVGIGTIGLSELLDCRPHWILISPCYGNGTKIMERLGVEMKEEMETNGEKTDANQEEMKAKTEVSN
jgi:hypothetical protein